MSSAVLEQIPSLCDFEDHEAWGKTRRFTYILVELALILCAVLLSQSVRSYGHAFAYVIVFAMCAIILQMMPFGFGDWTRGTAVAAAALSGNDLSLLKSNPFGSMLMTLTMQWLACLTAATVVQACGTFRWFHHQVVKYFNSRSKRAMLPTACACLGVFSALACGSDAINLMYIAPLISASKVIGLRPSKALSALIVGGMLGSACSPVSSAAQFYYNRYVSFPVADNVVIIDGPYELMPYGRLSACVIPAAVVGAVIAGVVATFIGHDLAESKTYQQRYAAGLVALPGEEDFATPGAYRSSTDTFARRESQNASKSMEDKAAAKSLPKLEKEFSMQSRLEDGDYVYTNARFREGTYVDINDRTGGAPTRQNSGTRKSVTINVKDQKAGETPTSAGAAAQNLADSSPAPRSALVCVGVMIGVGVLTALYGILRGIPKETVQSIDGLDEISVDNVIPDNWPIPAELIHPILIMVAAGILMLALRLRSWQLSHAPIVRQALPGIAGMICFCALGTSYLWEWKNHFNCIAVSWSGSTENAFTWPFWMLLMSIFSGSDMITQHRIAHYITFLPSITEKTRWLAAGFPAAACAFVLPTNANMLIASQLDDTGSTRLGDYLLDHVFVVPGLVGAASAAALAYCIAIGVFPM